MSDPSETPPAGRPAQERDDPREINARFAQVEAMAGRVALAAVIVSFGLYVSGVLPGFVPVERVPTLLAQGIDTFVATQHLPTGWRWLASPGHGDMLSLGALLLMIGVVVAAYLGLLPVLVRRRHRVYLTIVLLQLAVFALAASGLLDSVGGH